MMDKEDFKGLLALICSVMAIAEMEMIFLCVTAGDCVHFVFCPH